MAARTTRQEARERAREAFEASLNRIIPEDEGKPLRGRKFADWEQQVEQMVQAVAPTVMQERAALEDNAQVEEAGRCPYCSSQQVYLEKAATVQERLGPHGKVVIETQQARCRACGGSFSPSTARLATSRGGSSDRPRGSTAQPRGGSAKRRQRRASDQ